MAAQLSAAATIGAARLVAINLDDRPEDPRRRRALALGAH